MLNCLIVGLGGFIGTVCRYLIGLIPVNSENVFPYKTLIINVVGAFAIGVITALFLKNSNMDPKLVLFLKVGICGGFTTFSTFALESYDMFHSGNAVLALVYIVSSVVLSVAAVFGANEIFS